MSNDVLFTDAEQIDLQNLVRAQNQFETFRQLILRGNFEGKDSALVVQSVSFFEGMIKQTEEQLNALRLSAASRALKPKAESKKKGK
jgi:hypothetical protein